MLDQNIDTGNTTGRLLFNMLEAIAQLKMEAREELRVDRIRKAMDPDVHFGRNKSLTDERSVELREHRSLVKTLMKE